MHVDTSLEYEDANIITENLKCFKCFFVKSGNEFFELKKTPSNGAAKVFKMIFLTRIKSSIFYVQVLHLRKKRV
ncbi:MAG TPA: hypothetical protein DCY74_00210 [Clostridiales bacterium]|jgi:hypothetical protein|nr:hypothetical protein [Clostridiales bacterium]HBE12567.1 hypothetical protein [Clostridiales bacterium]HCG36742.1 hypothetical protein [Clostridiales bacterium]